MRHSIILWDCSFRSFFHTLESLVAQDFDDGEYEVIIVEQRSREVSDTRNHALHIASLWDKYLELKADASLQVIYMDEPKTVPFHMGRAVNKGISNCKGYIISVMDADLLLEGDFLAKLDLFHSENAGSGANLHRHMASRPVEVGFENWMDQNFDYRLCLEVSPSWKEPVPKSVSNKGPLMSAAAGTWRALNGYDEHLIWSTGVSRLGQDVNTRLEILTGHESVPLPDAYAVHPWHPEGFHRDTFDSVRMLDLQRAIIKWSRANSEPDWMSRLPFTEEIYRKNRRFVDGFTLSPLGQPGLRSIAPSEGWRLWPVRIPNARVAFKRLLGKIYRRYLLWER